MRVPYIAQMEAIDCGAASLGMVLAYFGHEASLSEVRQACAVSRDGADAGQILRAAQAYGLETNALRVEPEELHRLTRPVIIHWQMNHFVVLERWSPRKILIVDPAAGRRIVSHEEFDRSFTGIVLRLEPGETFRKRSRRRSWLRPLIGHLTDVRLPLFLILTSSVIINVVGLAMPAAIQVLVDDVLPRGRQTWLQVIVGSLLALALLKVLLGFLREWLLVSLQGFLERCRRRDRRSRPSGLPSCPDRRGSCSR